MKILSLILFIQTSIILSACSPLQKDITAPAIQKKAAEKSILPRSERSLYLASQAAMYNGQTELAVQFLAALLNQSSQANDADTLTPTLQLADLLLQNNQANQALQYLQKQIKSHPIAKDNTAAEKNLHIMYARSLAGTKQFNEALETLLKLLNQHPDLTPARRLQITLFTHTKQFSLAHIAINTAIKIQDSPALRQIEADIFSRQGKFDSAIKSLEKMYDLNPASDTAILLISQIHIQQGQLDKAEKVLRKFSKKMPKSLRIKHALARLLIQTKRPEKAILIYQNMIQALPENTEIISALGLLYYQQQLFEDSVAQFTKALQKNPNNQNYRFYLASSLEAAGKNTEARASYAQISPDHTLWKEAQLRLASLDFNAEKYSASLLHTQNILAKFPKNEQAWVLLSAIYLAQKEYQRSLDKTLPATKLEHVPARLLMNRAIAFEHFKRYNDVEQTLKALISSAPNHADALNFLAYTYAEQAIKLDEAEAYIHRAIKLQNNDGYYLDTLAWIYYQRGEYDKAIHTQQKALSIVNDDPTMQEHLGDMFWKQGNTEQAIKLWQTALNLNPEQPNTLKHKINHGLK